MNYIGEENFRKGLTDYFSQHKYSNTVADDLWNALSKASGKDIGLLMENWLNKPGFPIVEVDWEPLQNDIRLLQNRFVSGDNTGDTIWQLPLASNLEVDNNLLESKESSIKLLSSKKDALLLNSDGKSYFIPKYINEDHQEKICQRYQQTSNFRS
jgi:aminopeptidase N